MAKKESKNRSIVFIVCFLVLAVILVVLSHFVTRMLDENENTAEQSDLSGSIVTTEAVTEAAPEETTGPADEDTEEAETEIAPVVTSAHVSPTKLACSETINELDLSVVLETTAEESKVYNFYFGDIAEEGDMIESFTFTFHSEDGTPFGGEVRGGYGLPVDNSCPLKTKDYMYQDDFSLMVDGDSFTVERKVPDEVKDYITFSSGTVMVGYWWNKNVSKVVLDKVECQRKTLKEVPVDDEKSIDPGKQIKNTPQENKITVPVSDLIGADNELQVIDIVFEGSDVINSLSGKFGADTAVINGGHYESVKMGVKSSEKEVKLTWIVPDDVKADIKNSGNIDFTLDKCNLPEITVKNITAQYSIKQ